MTTKQEKINKIKALLMGKQFNMLIEKIEKLAHAIEKKPEPHIVNQVPAELRISNVADLPTDVSIKNFPDTQKVVIENHKDVQKVKIENQKDIQKVEIVNTEKIEVQKVEITNNEKASAWVPSIVASAIKGISDGIFKLWQTGITVKLDGEERLKPLPVIVVDVKGRPMNIGGQMGVAFMPGSQAGGFSGIGTGNTINSGRQTIATPGVAVQLISTITPCRKIIITAFPGNVNMIFLGGSNVSGVAGSEKGIMLTGIGMTTIEINDVSKVWIDAVQAGDGVSFSYIS